MAAASGDPAASGGLAVTHRSPATIGPHVEAHTTTDSVAAGSCRRLHLSPIRVGRWSVDPAQCRLSAVGANVHIRPQLMELLVYLADHAGQVVLKDEILDDVWGGRFVSESCLTRCIAQLRDALEGQADDAHYIETIPKRGYRLLAPVRGLDDAHDPPPPHRRRTAAGGAVAGALAAFVLGVALGSYGGAKSRRTGGSKKFGDSEEHC
jgi:DNA-binding winged helix-turn-helix (wHTH) protein